MVSPEFREYYADTVALILSLAFNAWIASERNATAFAKDANA
jgi:hypothetical protein